MSIESQLAAGRGGAIETAAWPATPLMTPRFDPLRTAAGELRPGGQWRPGDTVLFELTLRNRGDERRSLIQMTILGPGTPGGFRLTFASDSGPVEIEVDLVNVIVSTFEWDGLDPITLHRTDSRMAAMPDSALCYGLFEYIELYESASRSITGLQNGRNDQSVRIDESNLMRAAGWLGAMFGLARLFEDRDSREGQWLSEIIDRPSFLSIVMNGGVSVSFDFADEFDPAARSAVALRNHGGGERLHDRADTSLITMATPTTPMTAQESETAQTMAIQRLEGAHVPLILSLNSRPALIASVIAVPVISPLGPANGIIRIEAVNPNDASRSASLQLVGAWHEPIERGVVEWGVIGQ